MDFRTSGQGFTVRRLGLLIRSALESAESVPVFKPLLERIKVSLGWVLPPLIKNWMTFLISLDGAVNMTPNMDCSWVRAGPKIQPLNPRS